MMAAQHWNQGSDLTTALKSYTQADEDGVMVKVSRQACDEAVERIAQLEADLAAVQSEAEALREWQVRKNNAFAALEADLAAAQIRADAMFRVAEKHAAEAAALRALFGSVVRQNIAFKWDSEKQCHVPWIMVEFASVPNGEPNTAQGWRDRDAFAAAVDAARGGNHD